MPKVPLYKALKTSYTNDGKEANALSKYGYVLDKNLSNHNEKVYYNPQEKKLLNVVAGTHNLKDWGTDLYLAAGKLKSTNRYKEADRVLKEAKKKYNATGGVSVVGHSLGHAIASGIAGGADKVTTFNGAETLGQKKRSNVTAYRAKGDIVSILNKNALSRTLPNKFATSIEPIHNFITNPHDLKNLKGEQIFV
jgi:hypothetical protein